MNTCLECGGGLGFLSFLRGGLGLQGPLFYFRGACFSLEAKTTACTVRQKERKESMATLALCFVLCGKEKVLGENPSNLPKNAGGRRRALVPTWWSVWSHDALLCVPFPPPNPLPTPKPAIPRPHTPTHVHTAPCALSLSRCSPLSPHPNPPPQPLGWIPLFLGLPRAASVHPPTPNSQAPASSSERRGQQRATCRP